MGIYIIFALIGLAINLVLCFNFAQFADTKGYSFKKYFWICFFFGTIGYIWVAALPDVALLYKVTELEQKINKSRCNENASTTNNINTLKTSSYSTTIATPSESKKWICNNCQTKNSMDYGQCKKCGKYKS